MCQEWPRRATCGAFLASSLPPTFLDVQPTRRFNAHPQAEMDSREQRDTLSRSENPSWNGRIMENSSGLALSDTLSKVKPSA